MKDDWWDKQWADPQKYLDWLDKIAEQWQRILKPNGSLYCFASPRMAAKVEVLLSSRFNILNHLVWNKSGRSRAAQTDKEQSRIFFPESERIIFCEHYGSDNIAKGEAGYEVKCDELRGFVFEPIRAYLDEQKKKARAGHRFIIEQVLGLTGHDSHYFSPVQWKLPTSEHYTKLQQAFPGYFTRSHKDLRRQYEELRRQYEELRRPFSVSAEVPYTDVWSFPTVPAYPGKHPCEKPLALLEHIIKASSREGDVVLDCFTGSGSTLDAAKRNNRQFIGIEIDPHWVAIARQRLGDFEALTPSLEARQAWLESRSVPIKKPEPKDRQLTIWDFGIEKAG